MMIETLPNQQEEFSQHDGDTSRVGGGISSRCVAIIFNPVSGQGDPQQRKEAIAAAFAAHGYRCIHFETTPEEGAAQHTRSALADEPDVVAVSGGDGTVVEVMAALIGTQIPLIVLPSGTGNLLAHNLNLPLDTHAAAVAALNGTPQSLDLAQLTVLTDAAGKAASPDKSFHFAISAGAGFDANVIRDTTRDAKNKFGLLAYLFAATKNLYRRPVLARIFLDESSRPLRRRARSVMVANMGKIQGGVAVVPDARSDDGFLDVTILKAETLTDWLRLIWSALRRRLHEDSSIEFKRCRTVRVELSRPQALQYDGEEIEGRVRSFAATVVPAAVYLLMPNSEKDADSADESSRPGGVQ